MDNFLGTIVFLLPGVMAYFWLQAFGINPVTKHSPTEFTAVAGLLWLPVSFITLAIFNLVIYVSHVLIWVKQIWTVQDLKDASSSLMFLMAFLFFSLIVSFVLCWLWAKWGYKLQQKIVNKVRRSRGLADFSDNTSVWDEVFGKYEIQIVEIGKIDKPETKMIGQIRKASRPFESERNLCLDHVQLLTELVEKNPQITVSNIFIDTKSGTYVKIFDTEEIQKALDNSENLNDPQEVGALAE